MLSPAGAVPYICANETAEVILVGEEDTNSFCGDVSLHSWRCMQFYLHFICTNRMPYTSAFASAAQLHALLRANSVLRAE